jgi:hypothetical protein
MYLDKTNSYSSSIYEEKDQMKVCQEFRRLKIFEGKINVFTDTNDTMSRGIDIKLRTVEI